MNSSPWWAYEPSLPPPGATWNSIDSSIVVPVDRNSIRTPDSVSSTRRSAGRTRRPETRGRLKSADTVVPYALASRWSVATEALERCRSTALRKPVETRARCAATARLRPRLSRMRRSFGPNCETSRGARRFFSVVEGPSTCLMPGTFSCLTSRRYLMRFSSLISSGPYSR